MREECCMTAVQIKAMRYKRLIYVLIIALQPIILNLFRDFFTKA